MNNTELLDWKDYRKELVKKPGFQEALKDTELEYVVARAIIDARINKGFTQEKLAEAMSTKQSVISRVESAKTVPSLSFLKRLATALDVSLHVQFK